MRPELLETRRLFASAFANVNVSRTPGNHSEGTIVVDPTDASRLFAASNAPGVGLLGATSSDGGATWTTRPIADDPVAGADLSPDGLAPACCDPSAAFDRFGNLYLTYAHDADHGVEVVRSVDAGRTFATVASFAGDLDQPTVVTGADSVWVTFKRGSTVAAAGAAVSSLGGAVSFPAPAPVPGARGGNFGDIAVGSRGQVAVTYQQGRKISVSIDPDGLGPARFGRKVLATTTNVGGFDRIRAQEPRGVDAEASLAYDRTGISEFASRLYLMYSDEQPDGSDNLDVVLRYSSDDGISWSAPMRVNSDTGLASQFLPRLAVDDTTGDLGFGWYDTRNDAGAGSPGDTNGVPDDDAEYFVSRARPTSGGMLFGAEAQASAGASNSEAADNGIDLGDYTGLAFARGTLRPFWADNSNSTGDNPDGAQGRLDMYTAAVPASSLPAPTARWQGSTSGGFQAVYTPPRRYSLGGKPEYRFRVVYNASTEIDPASISDGDLSVSGPGGTFDEALGNLRVVSVRPLRRFGGVVATYSVAAPGGRWTSAHNGTYAITLRQGAVFDDTGSPSPLGLIGWFVVRTSLR